MGERHGFRQPGFDFSNSPAEVENVNFTNKTVILTTTTGTQGIIKATNAEEIITGSFVNAGAVVRYIKKKKPTTVSLICTDVRHKEGEDEMFAQYIKGCLKGKPLDFDFIRQHLVYHPCSKGFLVTPRTEFSEDDFDLAMHLNRFDFVLRAEKDDTMLCI